MSVTEAVLDFWFGDADEAREIWFAKDAAFDAEITARFAATYARAAAGALDHLIDGADGALALVIVLDQFPRNMFRGQARAFATDDKALAIARGALARGHHLAVGRVRRVFFHLPFEHAEDLACQRRSLALAEEVGAPEWAQRHYEIIARFGRFPHRNAALGRASTPEEIAFLEQPGSSF